MAHYNLANSLAALGRRGEAIARYQQAVALNPEYAAAHYNLGTVLAALNRHDEAIAHYESTLASAPDYPDAAWNRSLSLLSLGDYPNGLPGYESRWKRATAITLPNVDRPLWLGREPVAGRTLLIQHEQGFGDAIQMMRYVAALEGAGAHCTLQTPPALAALLARSFPNARVVPLGHCPADVELRIPVMSLPLAMQTFSESAVLAIVPYLIPDGQKAANWASRLTTHPAPTVGLVWRGLNTHQNDHNRSLALDALTPLLDRSHTRFVALQKDLTPSESERLARHDNVIVLDQALESFDDTAAVISTLDLVISVDSAPAHLSGALGTPAWILLPFNADWRWMVARDDSPWYPTAKLFRQASVGDWAEVIARVGEALDGRATGRPVDNQQMAGLMHSTLTARSEE